MIVLETERLNLRESEVDDSEFVFQLLNEPSFLEFIGDKGIKTLDDAAEYARTGPIASYKKHGFGLYVVELKDNNVPIGMCGLLKRDTLDDVDIGFAFLPDYWGRGYAMESARKVLTYGNQTLGFEKIVAITNENNESSIRLLEKMGLAFVDTIPWSGCDEKTLLYSRKFSDEDGRA